MRSRRFPGGYTLLEIALTMAIMAALLMIAMPLMERSLARAQFKSGVLALQTELLRTRLLAMKTGQVYIFRYMTGTDQYEIVPKEAYLERMEREQGRTPLGGTLNDHGAALTVTGETVDPFETSNPYEYTRRTTGSVLFGPGFVLDSPELKPKTDVFVDGHVQIDLGSEMVGSLTGLPGEEAFRAPWSPPIMFHPNGRVSQAVFQLMSDGDYRWYSEIALRGLTGTARVSAISAEPPGSPSFPGAMSPGQFAALGAATDGAWGMNANSGADVSDGAPAVDGDAAFPDDSFQKADVQDDLEPTY